MKLFDTFCDAVAWAKRNAKASCLPYQHWTVVKLQEENDAFAVAIHSRNTGYFSHYAE